MRRNGRYPSRSSGAWSQHLGISGAYFRTFDRVLRADGKSESTRKIYRDRAVSLDAWLDQLPVSSGVPRASAELTASQAPCDVTNRHIDSYIDAVAARTSQATASNHYRALQQFFKLRFLEEAISTDPFAQLGPPKVASKPVPVIPDDSLKRLLAAYKGTGLEALRDTAIIMVLIDTGMRLAEATSLNHSENIPESDVDFDYNVLHVADVSGRRRAVSFGRETRRALERYLRRRDEFLQVARLPTDGPCGSAPCAKAT